MIKAMMQKMKKLALLLPLGLMAFACQAQDEEKKGFDPNRVFVGGSIGLGLGFGSYQSSFTLGLYPQVGYSFTNWLDAGVVINGSYYNSKSTFISGVEDKYTTFTYGAGTFVRGFPFRSFFIQAQPEINWISYTRKYTGYADEKGTVNSPSLLLGVGFGNRVVGRSGFFTTIMIDVLNEPYSPYRYYGNILPIIQAGFVFYLNQKKQDRYLDYNNGNSSNGL